MGTSGAGGVDPAQSPEGPPDDIAEAGHDGWSVAGADGAGVLHSPSIPQQYPRRIAMSGCSSRPRPSPGLSTMVPLGPDSIRKPDDSSSTYGGPDGLGSTANVPGGIRTMGSVECPLASGGDASGRYQPSSTSGSGRDRSVTVGVTARWQLRHWNSVTKAPRFFDHYRRRCPCGRWSLNSQVKPGSSSAKLRAPSGRRT